MLDIPPSTLRRYVDRFGDFLSARAKKRRGREFTDNDLAILARVRDLAGQGIRLDDIAQELETIQDHVTQDESAKQETALMVLNRFIKQVESLDERVGVLRSEYDQDRPWREYHKALARWEALPWLKRLTTPRPNPPE